MTKFETNSNVETFPKSNLDDPILPGDLYDIVFSGDLRRKRKLEDPASTNLSLATILGAVVGALAIMLLLLILPVSWVIYQRLKDKRSSPAEKEDLPGPEHHQQHLPPRYDLAEEQNSDPTLIISHYQNLPPKGWLSKEILPTKPSFAWTSQPRKRKREMEEETRRERRRILGSRRRRRRTGKRGEMKVTLDGDTFVWRRWRKACRAVDLKTTSTVAEPKASNGPSGWTTTGKKINSIAQPSILGSFDIIPPPAALSFASSFENTLQPSALGPSFVFSPLSSTFSGTHSKAFTLGRKTKDLPDPQKTCQTSSRVNQLINLFEFGQNTAPPPFWFDFGTTRFNFDMETKLF